MQLTPIAVTVSVAGWLVARSREKVGYFREESAASGKKLR